MTQHLQQIRLESQILEEKNRSESLSSYTSTISHEFRTPLSTCLMFLESLMKHVKDPASLKTLEMVIS